MPLGGIPVHHRHVSGEIPQQLLPLIGSGHSQIPYTNPGPSLYYCQDLPVRRHLLVATHSFHIHLQQSKHCT